MFLNQRNTRLNSLKLEIASLSYLVHFLWIFEIVDDSGFELIVWSKDETLLQVRVIVDVGALFRNDEAPIRKAVGNSWKLEHSGDIVVVDVEDDLGSLKITRSFLAP